MAREAVWRAVATVVRPSCKISGFLDHVCVSFFLSLWLSLRRALYQVFFVCSVNSSHCHAVLLFERGWIIEERPTTWKDDDQVHHRRAPCSAELVLGRLVVCYPLARPHFCGRTWFGAVSLRWSRVCSVSTWWIVSRTAQEWRNCTVVKHACSKMQILCSTKTKWVP